MFNQLIRCDQNIFINKRDLKDDMVIKSYLSLNQHISNGFDINQKLFDINQNHFDKMLVS